MHTISLHKMQEIICERIDFPHVEILIHMCKKKSAYIVGYGIMWKCPVQM